MFHLFIFFYFIIHERYTIVTNILIKLINSIVFRVQNLLGGTNWVIKVQIGEGNHDYLHLMIHQTVGVPVPIPPELTGLQQGHTAHDPLVPF